MKYLICLLLLSGCSSTKYSFLNILAGFKGSQELYEALDVEEKKIKGDVKTFKKSGENFECKKRIFSESPLSQNFICKFKTNSGSLRQGFFSKKIEYKHQIEFTNSELAKELFEKTKSNKKNPWDKNFGNFSLSKSNLVDGKNKSIYNHTLLIKLDLKK